MTLACVLVLTCCGQPAQQSSDQFFANLIPGDLEDGRIYLQVPLPGPTRRAAFFDKAVPGFEKFAELPEDSRKEGHGGEIIPDQYLDLEFVQSNTPFQVGQALIVRTRAGLLPVRIARHEIHADIYAGNFYFYAIAEPAPGIARSEGKERVVAASHLYDCGGQCALVKRKPAADAAEKVRAVAVGQLAVTFPGDLPSEERTETLEIYQGNFTRTDAQQYVAFFARHSKEALDVGHWAAFVVDSDFSLIAVLRRDEYLQVVPEGVADINGDGLHEIWTDEVGYEGTAYSVWYMSKRQGPTTFSRIGWDYWGI